MRSFVMTLADRRARALLAERPRRCRHGPHVGGEQRQNRREVDGEVHVVLELEAARPQVRSREAHHGCGAEPAELCAPGVGMCLAAGVAWAKLLGMKPTRFHGVNVGSARRAAIGTKPHASHG